LFSPLITPLVCFDFISPFLRLIRAVRHTLPRALSGTVVGLVVITPASGYVDQTAAFAMGVAATPVVYWGVQVSDVGPSKSSTPFS
jgi:ammonia channel protein AmtB